MSGLDRLLSKRLNQTIRNNLGEKASQKIEDRLFQKYGLSIIEAIEQFQKLDSVLREYFGAGADGLEKRFLESICEIKSKQRSEGWISIKDSDVSKTILEAYGDEDKEKILNSIIDEPKIISDILSLSKIPQTSGYRKINQMIKEGLLVPSGHLVAQDGRKVKKYRTLFKNLKIGIQKNKISVEVLIDPSIEQSSVIEVIYGI